MTATSSHVGPHEKSRKSASAAVAPPTLDELLALDTDALRELYENAKTPSISDLRGDLEGRMLTSPHGGETLARVMRSLASLRQFPWRGKSFNPVSDTRGEGINRVFSDKNRWFRFETFIGPSRAGDFDALQLDYDNRQNPAVIRAVKDEVRALAPGLFLGQAYVVVRGKATLALYFALASRGGA